MDKKTIDSNIEKFSQISNSTIEWTSSVQSKWEVILTEAKTGALREMREAINVISMLSYALQYLKIIVLSPEAYKESVE